MAKIRYFQNSSLHCPRIAHFTKCETYLLSLPCGFPGNNKANETSVHYQAGLLGPLLEDFCCKIITVSLL